MREKEGAQHWILPGDSNNWLLGIERKVWGVRDRPSLRRVWTSLKPGDLLYFYVTRPISGVVGMGKVLAKFEGREPLWPDELQARTVIYPLRFEMEITALLPPERWATEAIDVQPLRIFVKTMNSLSPEKATLLLQKLQEKITQGPGTVSERDRAHHTIQELLLEIGRMKGFYVEKEFPLDNERIDVVWKRVQLGVPTYAFEIQIGGEIYRALGKLKHAFDLWNSRIYLVMERRWDARVEELLSGTFHEIKDYLRKIFLDDVEQLTEALKRLRSIEEKLGL